MISFLFWNLMGNQRSTWGERSEALRSHICRLVQLHDPDVVLFVESAFAPAEIVEALNGGQTEPYCHPPSHSTRVQLFTRLGTNAVKDQFNDSSDGRLTTRGSHWHLYDQVPLRPALMDTLAELRILEDDGRESLLTDRKHPRSSHASDHLALLFRLRL